MRLISLYFVENFLLSHGDGRRFFLYQFSWDSNAFADGGVTLTAVADAAAGNEGTSASVSVSVDNIIDVVDTVPPAVTISNPTDGSSVTRTVNILVYAQDDVAVGQIELFIDET